MSGNNQEIIINEKHLKWWKELDNNWKEVFQNPSIGKIIGEYPENWQLKRIINSKTIFCSDKEIKTLEPIRVIENLEKLICCNNEITSLEPILKLNNLNWLNCEKNRISKKELKRFKEIHPNCRVKSKSPIIELKAQTLVAIIATPLLIAWHYFDLGNTFLVVPMAILMIIISL